MSDMRAKMRVSGIEAYGEKGKEGYAETVRFSAVCKNEGYDETGDDENNTFSKFTPSAEASFYIANPALHGTFEVGKEYYVDFTKAD